MISNLGAIKSAIHKHVFQKVAIFSDTSSSITHCASQEPEKRFYPLRASRVILLLSKDEQSSDDENAEQDGNYDWTD